MQFLQALTSTIKHVDIDSIKAHRVLIGPKSQIDKKTVDIAEAVFKDAQAKNLLAACGVVWFSVTVTAQ